MNKLFSASPHNRVIVQWYLKIFSIVSLIFALTLIPITIYLQNTFTRFQLQKAENRLNAGITQLDATISSIASMPQTLSSDSRFLYHYSFHGDYAAVPVETRNQIKNIFSGMTLPLTLVTDIALQLSDNVVVSSKYLFWEDSNLLYYPDFFCVDDLTAEEWMQILTETKSGFVPIRHIQTKNREYDALIFVTRLSRSSYIYACFDISDLEDLLIEESDRNKCYFSISSIDGTCLYENLPEQVVKYKTLTQENTMGNLEISIYIPNDLFYVKMQPLYYFLGIYFVCCILLLILTTLTGSRVSARPVYEIICFANHRMRVYKETIDTQKKILRARFLEKAINGQLLSSNDISLFHSFFPNFPDSYCLILIRLQLHTADAETRYVDPLLLLQTFFQDELPGTYLQQLSPTDLLLIVSEKDYEEQSKVLAFVVGNVQKEEPSYRINCVVSKFYHHIENLPVAYCQIQNMIEFNFSNDSGCLHTVADHPIMQKMPFAMADLLTLYTAITHGNREMALNTMQGFSQELAFAQNATLDRHVYEMVRTILSCIILEHPLQLFEQHIPPYQANVILRADDTTQKENNLYAQLAEKIGTFCDLISENGGENADSFARELLYYVDTHYTDSDLCLTALEDYFNRSSSNIRKIFKEMTNTTISKYVEQKRMNRANMLLAQKQMTIEEIALECGYTNANSFYKAYKRIYGCAPTVQMHT